MKKETWIDVKDYEGLYQVSNLGRVRSLNFNHTYNKAKLLKQAEHYHGYKYVRLYKNKKQFKYYVHRLVAEAFIENPNNYTEINHKDENKQNNIVDNLEWCNRSYNMVYSKGKKVEQYSKENQYIKTWNSIREASRELNIKDSNISICCKHKIKTAGGYIWKYAKEEIC